MIGLALGNGQRISWAKAEKNLSFSNASRSLHEKTLRIPSPAGCYSVAEALILGVAPAQNVSHQVENLLFFQKV